ncbi:MAG TPA: type IV pilus assembly protein PilM [Candidatus Polarisedimenticolia bacterium]|nr:type IV pilus assembly protein PilM [Candidatus Polarisedimenticolia bacterium]
MFFSKSKTLVGLDIGSSAVKVVELKELGKGKGYQLLNVALERLSPEAIVDGAIMDSGLVIDTIQRAFSSRRIKCADVAIALSGHSVIIKKISIPATSEEELAEVIPWEAEQYIPFDVEDVNLAYQVLKGGSNGEGNMDVLLVAAKKDKINDYTSVVSQAGRNPLLVDVDVFALQNCYEMNYDTDATMGTALINIGASTTNVSILKGTTSIFWRDISVGGNHFNDAIRKELNLSFDQAESLKRGEEVDGIPVENVTPIITSVNDFIGTEIQKTVDFFKNTTPGENIERLVLAGGSSRVPHLKEALSERFGVPTEPLNPFNRVQVGRGISPETLEELGSSVSIAVGLASRRVGDNR